MENTLRLARKFIRTQLREMKLTDEQLIERYQITYEDGILALLFERHFGQFVRIADKFILLTNEDKEAQVLKSIDKALLSFNKGRGVKFLTFATKCYYNDLSTMSNILYKPAKRNANIDPEVHTPLESFDALHEECGFEPADTSKTVLEDMVTKEHELELIEYLENMNLTELEIKYCELAIDGYEGYKNIAQVLGISFIKLADLRDSLQQKLSLPALCSC